MRRAVITLLVAVLGLVSGCTYTVRGTALPVLRLDVDPPFSTGQSAPPASSSTVDTAPSTSGSDGVPAPDVCSLMGWRDLPYTVLDPSAPPTDTDYDKTFDQSCKWQTSVDSFDVGVSLRYRVGKSIIMDRKTGELEIGGRKVTYFDRTDDPEVQPSCVLVLDYAGGGLGIIVIDGSSRLGPICDQGKHVAEVLLAKEPAG